MKISILIVSWNVKALLLGCLESIRYECAALDAQIVLVDNASSDGTVEEVGRLFPAVEVIASELNRGFAEANNLGVERCNGDAILLLNPDTLVPNGTIIAMLATISTHPEIAAVSPCVFNADGTYQANTIRGFPRLRDEIFHLFLLNRILPRSRFFGHYTQARADIRVSREVEVLTGCCMLIRKEAFISAGGFDSTVPMFLDDLDLSRRLVKNGWKNYYLAAVCITHFGGQSSKQSPIWYRLEAMQSCAMNVYFKKYHSRLTAWLHRMILASGAVFRLLIITIGLIPARIIGKGGSDFSRRTMMKYWTVLRVSLGHVPHLR